ncbi:MAG TPA: alpha/beta fold hydrolase [Propionibacteriaceae bacterium]|jgi:carboxylesterase
MWRERVDRWRSSSPREPVTSAAVDPGAEPFYAGSSRVGVLLIHGFTGSPRSVRAWAEHLAADGFRVALPRLPGHGTSWQELALTEWQDWYATVERELATLRHGCDQIFLCGLSMGGGLALLAASRHPEIAGVVLVNAVVTSSDPRARALPILRWFVRSLAGISDDIAKPGVAEGGYDRSPLRAGYSMTRMWREIRRALPSVRQPLLVYRSVQDHVVDPSSGRAILAAVGSSDVREVLLHRSYHVATMDYDAEDIFAGSSAFFRRLLPS